MKRNAILFGLLILLLAPWLVQAQSPAQRVIIVDQTGTHAASVSGGSLGTSGSPGGSSDAVNVFHQSTIRHISSVTHVVALGHLAVTPGSVPLQVDCSNCSAASSVVVSHVQSVTHVAGTIVLRNTEGTAVTVTGTALDVNCTGCAAASSVTVSHIQAVTHVALVAAFGQHFGVAQSGTWNVNAHVQAGATIAATQSGVWTVQHVASMLHVVIVDLPRWAHLAVAQSGTWNIAAAHQGGNWNIQHQSTVRHVTLVGSATKPGSGHLLVEMTGPHATGAIHVAGLSNVGSGNAGTGTTAMICHSNVAFSTTADLVLAHSQNAMRIFICSVVLVNASAESVSITEGTGSACGTGTRGVIGGFGGTMSLAANGGFSMVSPVPILASTVPGNQVCLDKSGSGNVSGNITYRASP